MASATMPDHEEATVGSPWAGARWSTSRKACRSTMSVSRVPWHTLHRNTAWSAADNTAACMLAQPVHANLATAWTSNAALVR